MGVALATGSFASLTTQLAGALRTVGVTAGDRVVAQIEKSPEAVALYLACLEVGAAFIPLNTDYTLAELEYFLTDAAPTLAVVRPGIWTRSLDRRTRSREFRRHDRRRRRRIADEPGRSRTTVAHSPSSLAALLYTSGTTGRSKGAMLTRAISRPTPSRWRPRGASAAPTCCSMRCRSSTCMGCSLRSTRCSPPARRALPPKFDVHEVMRLLPQASVMMGVPTFYTRLLQQPQFGRDVVNRVRLFISGSAPLLAETHREFQARTGHAILERYGMSETLMNTSNPYDGPSAPPARWARRCRASRCALPTRTGARRSPSRMRSA